MIHETYICTFVSAVCFVIALVIAFISGAVATSDNIKDEKGNVDRELRRTIWLTLFIGAIVMLLAGMSFMEHFTSTTPITLEQMTQGDNNDRTEPSEY